MAANSRSKAATWGQRDTVAASQFEIVEENAAHSINRHNTAGGYRRHPLLPVETIDSSGGGLGTRMCSALYGDLVCANVAYDLYLNLLPMPHGHVLNKVKMHAHPAGGHGAQPAVLVSMHIYKIAADGTATLLGSATHTWADIATYELGFTLETAALAHTIDNTAYTYQAKIILESGANSVTGCVLNNMQVSVTIDASEAGPDLTFWP